MIHHTARADSAASPQQARFRASLHTLSRCLGAALVLALLSQAAAQDTPTATSDTAGGTKLSEVLVEQRIEAIDKATDLPEAERNKLTGELNAVLKDLRDAQRFEAAAADYAAAVKQAPEQIETIRAQLAQAGDSPAEPALDLPKDADLATVESRIAETQADTAAIEARIAKLSEALEADDQQPAKIRERLAAIGAELTDLEVPAPDAEGLSERARGVSEWQHQARRARLLAEQRMLEQQLVSADARRQLTQAKRDRQALALDQAKARRKALEARADTLRKAAAAAVQENLDAERLATSNAHPLVQEWVERNAELGRAISDTTAALTELDQRRAKTEETTARIEEEFANARERLEAAGMNRAQGQVLIDQRARLPDSRGLRKQAAERAERMADSTLASIRWREELRGLDDLDAWVQRQLDALPAEALAGEARPQLKQELRAQGETRRKLLRTALDTADRYRRGLGEVDFAAQRLLDVTRRYERYLSERLLWVRSIGPITQQSFVALPAALYWLVRPDNWAAVGATLATEATRSATLWLGLAAVTVLFWRNAAIKRRIRASAEPLRRVSTDRFGYTLLALGLTMLAALPGSLLAFTLGYVLSSSLAANGFTKALGDALMAIVPALFYLIAFRMLCMHGGVADRHFRWRTDTLLLVRRSTYWAAALLLPVGLVATVVYSYRDPEFTGTLGRLSLALFELGFAALMLITLHPRRGAFKHVLAEHPDGWLNRLRMLWYPATAAVPLALAGLSLAGFLYTSGTLLRSLVDELWLALGLIVTHQLIARWLLVTRRQLALQAALDRRAQREAAKTAKPAEGSNAEVLAIPEESVDLDALDTQTRKLLNLAIFVAAVVGLWLIWSSVLPALNIFERVTLWSYTGTVDGIERAVPVTLADLALVLVIIAGSIAAARNLPALLEILLLRNSAITAGSRYTITTLTGYTIIAVGALMVFGTLGLTWGQVQWLVAALGVGIGFGLQEIVANFISGLIILFERPVRVGDIVTIGDTDGVVTKIEIRATTVRNWDRKELLVPNKELITGRVINWTLTDQINRIVIPVGVEYGSDTRKALALLADVAREQENVLDDPAPLISFEGFGNDALNLVLRCYLPTMDNRIATITALHQAIDDKFRAAGIGIAFPQRDIHLRSAEPLDIHLRRAERPAEGHGDGAQEGDGSAPAATA